MLLRLAYLTVTNAFAALQLLPMSDRDKDVEILVLRHQLAVLERQLGADTRVRFAPEDRVLLAALLTSLPRKLFCRLRLLVGPDTVLRRHCDRDLTELNDPRSTRRRPVVAGMTSEYCHAAQPQLMPRNPIFERTRSPVRSWTPGGSMQTRRTRLGPRRCQHPLNCDRRELPRDRWSRLCSRPVVHR
ncbi:hypothetical protein [Nonomuraea phyllanthi]|uniref:hypothetical protein n=1 Tax=Nonomuraea phyllanthi TaxID=2219224 RepID=UPI001D018E28|nr:hypothetical protein [Nonomuraea phyllanthi]